MTIVYLRDSTTGRVHRATRIDGIKELQTFESDNLDASGRREEISEEQFLDVEPGDLCRRCFPPVSLTSATISNTEGAPV